jgi:predicted dehydrogenase
MQPKLRWGILGTASIAVRRMIPALAACETGEAVAIASRDAAKAAQTAAACGISRSYGSYEELLRDQQVDCVYIPLPNHLHVEWTVRALEAGKHVLCEKPLAWSAHDVEQVMEVQQRSGRLAMEGFMVRCHPRWIRSRQLIELGTLGPLRSVHGVFAYFNRDPGNVRNRKDWGGGGILDIGCYPVYVARWMFGAEPLRVAAIAERDPEFGVDRLASALLEFEHGQASFVCGTQLARAQRMELHGEQARAEIEIPFNPPTDRPARLWLDEGDLTGETRRLEAFAPCDQFVLQADAFANAVWGLAPPPVPLDDSRRQAAVLEAILLAAESRQWATVSG